MSSITEVAHAQELSLSIGTGFNGQTVLGWRRNGRAAQAPGFNSVYVPNGSWHHIVATMDYATGNCSFYVNGTHIASVDGETLGDAYQIIPPTGGQLILGFILEATFTIPAAINYVSAMLLDDLRVHDRVLTAEEVRAGAWRLPSEMPSSYTDSLALHWAFEEPGSAAEEDLSGQGAHGERGAIERIPGAIIGSRAGEVAVVPPIISSSGIYLTAHENRAVLVAPGKTIDLPIPMNLNDSAEATTTAKLLRLPSSGSLSWLLPDGSSAAASINDTGSPSKLRYTAPSGNWSLSDAHRISDTIQWEIGGKVFTITMHPREKCAAPVHQLFRQAVGVPTLIELGGLCWDGRRVMPVIQGPPSRGRLFEFLPNRQFWPTYLPLTVRSRRFVLMLSHSAQLQHPCIFI